MIYFVTVHWKSERWIDIQRTMLNRYAGQDYRVFAFLNGIAVDQYAKFDFVLDDPDPPHDVKLDLLAEAVLARAESPEDWIVFLDGDAFPIREMTSYFNAVLPEHPLAAIQRLENLGERQPHPAFCITTVGFWRQIKGTWKKGYRWVNAMGNPETDVGGDLLGILEREQISWRPLLRSNTRNINPIFFGVYGDIVYHHGAGFRGGGCRIIWFERGLYEVYKRPDARILNNIVPRKYLRRMRESWIHPEGRLKRRIARELAPLAEEVFQQLQRDPDFAGSLIQ